MVTGDISNSNFSGRDGSFQTTNTTVQNTNTNIQNKWDILVRDLTDLHNKLPLNSEERKVVTQAIHYSKNKDKKGFVFTPQIFVISSKLKAGTE